MISIAYWIDSEDGHLYGVGEPFPFDGREIPEERKRELCSSLNKAGFPLVSDEDEQEPVKEDEPGKTAEKHRKNDT